MSKGTKLREQGLSKKLSCISLLAVYIAMVVYFITLSVTTSFKHYTFHSEAFDLGIFVNLLWNNVHGRIWYVWPRASEAYSKYFPHISPLSLFLLTPIYFILPSPYTLLILQSAVLSLPALYIFKIGKFVLKNDRPAAVLAIIHLMHFGTIWSNLYDFHLECLIPLFFFMMFYYWLTGNTKLFIVSTILLFSTLHEASLMVIAFIIYVLIKEHGVKSLLNPKKLLSFKKTLLLLVLLLSSTIYFFVCEALINRLFPVRSIYEKPTYMSLSPQNILQDTYLKIGYILVLMLPLGFLPMFSLTELIPASPYIALALVSTHQPYYSIVWQYNVIPLPPMFIATIYAMKNSNKLKAAGKKLLVLTTVSLIVLGPINPVLLQYAPGFTQGYMFELPCERHIYGHKILSLIEPNASVLAQENIYPHLADRFLIHSLWPKNFPPPQYIVLDFMSQYYVNAQLERDKGDGSIIEQTLELMDRYSYGVYASAYGLVLLKLNYFGAPKIFVPLKREVSLNALVPEPPATISANGLYIPKNFSSISNSYYVWHGPGIPLLPGNYTIRIYFGSVQSPINISEKVFELQAIKWSPTNVTYFARRWISVKDLNEGIVEFRFRVNKPYRCFEIVGAQWQGIADVTIKNVELLWDSL